MTSFANVPKAHKLWVDLFSEKNSKFMTCSRAHIFSIVLNFNINFPGKVLQKHRVRVAWWRRKMDFDVFGPIKLLNHFWLATSDSAQTFLPYPLLCHDKSIRKSVCLLNSSAAFPFCIEISPITHDSVGEVFFVVGKSACSVFCFLWEHIWQWPLKRCSTEPMHTIPLKLNFWGKNFQNKYNCVN